MNTVGIISEYNPFHNGHKLHIAEARKLSGCAFVIAIMSGHFLQRGEPAIFDKWSRAAVAVENGADLVLELPFIFAVRSAQYFAEGGIRLLNSLNIVSHVSFGAECADLPLLAKAASLVDLKESHIFSNNLKQGQSYAAALANTLAAKFPDLPLAVLTSPNNILAIEYLKAITNFAPTLIPVAIKRCQANYHDKNITGSIASATAIRHSLLKNCCLDISTSCTLPVTSAQQVSKLLAEGSGPVTLDNFANIILAKLRLADISFLQDLPEVSEGLHYKLKTAALKASNITELISLLKTKRYPFTRLQRILIHCLVGTSKTAVAPLQTLGPLYGRVLAFNTNGKKLVRELHSCASIPIITKTAQYLNSKQRDYHPPALTDLQKMLAVDTFATDIYNLGIPNPLQRQGGADFQHSPLNLSDD